MVEISATGGMVDIVAAIEIMMIFVVAIVEAMVGALVVFAAMVIVIFMVVNVNFVAVIVANLLKGDQHAHELINELEADLSAKKITALKKRAPEWSAKFLN